MAERRMFAKSVIDSDVFLDMPLSTQALYFHLGMRADDDGFVNNPKKIMRMIGASDDELKVLFTKKFILTFESGIIVIKHWKIHNYIQKDRYKETNYLTEKAQIVEKTNRIYSMYTKCIQNGDTDKSSIDKNREDKNKKTFPEDSDELRLATLLFDLILSNNPESKQPNLQSWAKDIDLMIRIDKRPVNAIEGAIRWCQQDQFWHKNILSASKLRKQYDG